MNNLVDMDRLIAILTADDDGDAAYNALSPEMRAFFDTGDPTHLAAYNARRSINPEQAAIMGELSAALTNAAAAIATSGSVEVRS